MGKKNEPPRKRVSFHATEDGPELANVWVQVEPDGFLLEHAYPDLAPEPGWLVRASTGEVYVITAISGRHLTTEEA